MNIFITPLIVALLLFLAAAVLFVEAVRTVAQRKSRGTTVLVLYMSLLTAALGLVSLAAVFLVPR